MTPLHLVRLLLVGVALVAHGIFPVRAQDFPTRPVTMVVPFAAGGAGDILSRMLAPRLEQVWGKPLIVDNKPGAGGVIGAQAVARAVPDGHTLMIAASPGMAGNSTFFQKRFYDSGVRFFALGLPAPTPLRFG